MATMSRRRRGRWGDDTMTDGKRWTTETDDGRWTMDDGGGGPQLQQHNN